MPLFAIIHIDGDGLHSSSCTVVVAPSAAAIAQNILANPDPWHAPLLYAYPSDRDPRSIWQRIQADSLEPEELIELINQTRLDTLSGEMLRIYPIEIQALDSLQLNSRWSSSVTAGSLAMSSPYQNSQPLFAQLAQDARSLLSTPAFQEYMENLLNQNIWKYSELRSLRLDTSNLSTWHLPSLGFPLKISNIQKIQESSANEHRLNPLPQHLCINICFGLWQQSLKIPMHEEDIDFSEAGADELEQRWLVVGSCLKDTIGRSEFLISPEVTAEQQSKLILELTCLLSYIVELLVFKDTSSS